MSPVGPGTSQPGPAGFDELDHPRSPEGTGRFVPKAHQPSAVQLAASEPDPEAVLTAVARRLGEDEGGSLLRRLEQEDAASVLADLESDNVGGRCRQDINTGDEYTLWCPRCVRAQALEFQLRPTPDPAVRGTVPVGSEPTYQLVPEESGPFDAWHKKTTSFGANDAFSGAARQLLGAGDDDPVDVIEVTTDYAPQWWTGNFGTEITISAGGKSASFEDLGSLMRAVEAGTRPDVEQTALRFCQDPQAEGTPMVGTAAVCLWPQGEDEPEVLFGRVMMVHRLGSGSEVAMLLRDGSERNVRVDAISAILETEDSREAPAKKRR